MKKPNPKENNLITGDLGEKLAIRYLKQKGYKLIANNYRTPLGEIDIIAEEKNITVFVEVKTRRSEKFGNPLSSITYHKQKQIIKNCLYFLKKFFLMDHPFRIDCIGILLNDKNNSNVITHLKNVIEIEY